MYTFQTIFISANVAVLDFVVCQSVAEGGEYP